MYSDKSDGEGYENILCWLTSGAQLDSRAYSHVDDIKRELFPTKIRSNWPITKGKST